MTCTGGIRVGSRRERLTDKNSISLFFSEDHLVVARWPEATSNPAWAT